MSQGFNNHPPHSDLGLIAGICAALSICIVLIFVASAVVLVAGPNRVAAFEPLPRTVSWDLAR